MPAPYNYATRGVDVDNYFDAFRQGRQDKLAGEADARSKSLAQYLPGALKGEEGMRDQALASASPDQQIALTGTFAQIDAGKMAQVREKHGRFASLLTAVQNRQIPLDRAKQIAVSELGIDPQKVANVTEADIPAFIAQTQTVTEQLERADKERAYLLDAERTRASTSRDYAAAAKDRAAFAPQIGPDGKPMPAPPGDKQIDNEGKIRGEYLKGSDEFVKVRDAFGRIVASAKDPSAAGDLALIFSYMKILDPGSVVREQEFANAQNAAGVPDQIRAQYNKIVAGERLAPAQRSDFTNRAGRLYKQQLDSFGKTRALYEGISKEYGFAPSRTAPDLSLGVTGDELAPPKLSQPPQQAMDHLKANPGLAADFDRKYGVGWSKRILGAR